MRFVREFFLKRNVEEFEIKSSHRVIKNEKKRSKKQLVSTPWMAGEREPMPSLSRHPYGSTIRPGGAQRMRHLFFLFTTGGSRAATIA